MPKTAIPRSEFFPPDTKLRPNVVQGNDHGRLELWRKLDEQQKVWQRILARNDADIRDRNGLRTVSVGVSRWKELGFLRSFKKENDEQVIPMEKKGVRVEPEPPKERVPEPYLVSHVQQKITEDLLRNAGLEFDSVEHLDTTGRIALITGMYRELTQRALNEVELDYHFDPELEMQLGGPEQTATLFRKLDIPTLYRQIASVTGSTAKSHSVPIVPYDTFGWKMRGDANKMKFAYDSTRHQFQFLAHTSFQEKLGVPPEQITQHPAASRELLSHEFAHRRTRWMWNNPMMIEAVPYVANSLVAEEYNENFSGYIHEAPQILLALNPDGTPMEEPGFDVGDNVDYVNLGVMGDMVIRSAGYHLFRKWLGGDRRNWQAFIQCCDQSSFGGQMPEKEEFLRKMDLKVPGFKERFESDAFTKPAKDGTYLVFLPNTHTSRSQENPLHRGQLYHFHYHRNPNYGLTDMRAPSQQPKHPKDFDFHPGSVESFPVQIVYEWQTEGKPIVLTQSSQEGTIGAQFVYPFMHIHKGHINPPTDECRITIVVPSKVAGQEKRYDLGIFSSKESRMDSDDVNTFRVSK